MTEIVCTLITSVAGIIVALLGIHIKRSNDRSEHRAQVRERESLLSLRMADATLQLSVVSSNALTDHKNNGNVERAREAAEAAAADYQAFMQELTAHQVGKQ